jgi:hypothetical protein
MTIHYLKYQGPLIYIMVTTIFEINYYYLLRDHYYPHQSAISVAMYYNDDINCFVNKYYYIFIQIIIAKASM